MLNSSVLPVMLLYCLPHGQYGYSGHVSTPMPPAYRLVYYQLAMTVPRELNVIVARKEGASQSHCDLHVKISSVLQWLLANNCCHRIYIHSDAPTVLPEDSDLTGVCSEQRAQNRQRPVLCSEVVFNSCTLSLLIASLA